MNGEVDSIIGDQKENKPTKRNQDTSESKWKTWKKYFDYLLLSMKLFNILSKRSLLERPNHPRLFLN